MELNKDIVALILAAMATGLGIFTHFQESRNSAVENVAMGLLGMAAASLGTNRSDTMGKQSQRKTHRLLKPMLGNENLIEEDVEENLFS